MVYEELSSQAPISKDDLNAHGIKVYDNQEAAGWSRKEIPKFFTEQRGLIIKDAFEKDPATPLQILRSTKEPGKHQVFPDEIETIHIGKAGEKTFLDTYFGKQEKIVCTTSASTRGEVSYISANFSSAQVDKGGKITHEKKVFITRGAFNIDGSNFNTRMIEITESAGTQASRVARVTTIDQSTPAQEEQKIHWIADKFTTELDSPTKARVILIEFDSKEQNNPFTKKLPRIELDTPENRTKCLENGGKITHEYILPQRTVWEVRRLYGGDNTEPETKFTVTDKVVVPDEITDLFRGTYLNFADQKSELNPEGAVFAPIDNSLSQLTKQSSVT